MSVFDGDAPDALPRRLFGYDCNRTDAFLGEVERSYRALLGERDAARAELAEARAQMDALEQEMVRHRERSEAIAEALIRGAQLEAESRQKAQSIEAEARLRADQMLRDAEAGVGQLVGDAELDLSERRAEAEDALREAKERLSLLFRDLLYRVTKGVGTPTGQSELEAGSAAAREGMGQADELRSRLAAVRDS